jgi:excisionase family DNA binding protein
MTRVSSPSPEDSAGVPNSVRCPLVDATAAAELLAVPVSWVRAEARSGRIPHRRLGKYVRFDLDDLAVWSEAQRRGPRVHNPKDDG